MKKDYQKALKKLTLFFLSNPVPFNEQDKKEKGPGNSNQLLSRWQSKFRKIPLLVIYYLTKLDDTIQSGFLVIPKTWSANLCKPIHDIIDYSFLHLNLKNVERKVKTTNIRIPQERKELFRWNKKHFPEFWRAIIRWKNRAQALNKR